MISVAIFDYGEEMFMKWFKESFSAKMVSIILTLYLVFCGISTICWYQNFTNEAVNTAERNFSGLISALNENFEKSERFLFHSAKESVIIQLHVWHAKYSCIHTGQSNQEEKTHYEENHCIADGSRNGTRTRRLRREEGRAEARRAEARRRHRARG